MMVDTSQGIENTDVFYLDLAAGLGSLYIQEQQEQKNIYFAFAMSKCKYILEK